MPHAFTSAGSRDLATRSRGTALAALTGIALLAGVLLSAAPALADTAATATDWLATSTVTPAASTMTASPAGSYVPTMRPVYVPMPAVVSPAPVPVALSGSRNRIIAADHLYTLTGTATPGATVYLHFHRFGMVGGDFSIVRSVVAAANGTWTRPYLADVDYRVFASSTAVEVAPSTLLQARN